MNLMQALRPTHLEKALTYAQYRLLMNTLVHENKTTGPSQSPRMIDYTKLNLRRIERLEKTTVLTKDVLEAVENLSRNLLWVIITEAWCGDAAQNLPVLAKIMEAARGKIQMKLLLRDENPEVMDAYLTNGTRSIPKLVCLDAKTGEELGTWGPRPAEAHQIVVEAKKQGTPHDIYIEQVHAWYAKNKSQHLMAEITALLRQWA